MKRINMRRTRAVVSGTDKYQLEPATAIAPFVECECCSGPGIAGAICPYSQDVDDIEHVCNCCVDCSNRCTDSI